MFPLLSPFAESMRAPPNHVAMMQIDCEVINTRLIHVREDAIPMHLSAQGRTRFSAIVMMMLC